MSRQDFDKATKPSSAMSKELNRGCVGLTNCQLGPNPNTGTYPEFPEQYPGTDCYLLEPEADEQGKKCPKNTRAQVFSKQGIYNYGKPRPDKSGKIPTNSVRGNGRSTGGYNYLTKIPVGDGQYRYGWMNWGIGGGPKPTDPSIVKFDDEPVDDETYPDKIWCVACVPCKSN